MSSETDQAVKKPKRIPRKYDPNFVAPKVSENSRLDDRNEGGRKPIDIDFKKLEQFMWTKPTLEIAALHFGVHHDTLERIIRERYALTFAEFRSKQIASVGLALTQKAISMALEKDKPSERMLALALKNYCNWSDVVDMKVSQAQAIQLRYSLDVPPPAPDIVDVTPAKTE